MDHTRTLVEMTSETERTFMSIYTATIAGDTLTTWTGAPYTWHTVAAAVRDLSATYPDDLSAIEIYRDGVKVASMLN